MTQTVWEADGLRFEVNVAMQDPAVPDLTGAVLEVFAALRNEEIVGVATLDGLTRVRCTFQPWSLRPARYRVQLRATLAGRTQTLVDFDQVIKDSLGQP